MTELATEGKNNIFVISIRRDTRLVYCYFVIVVFDGFILKLFLRKYLFKHRCLNSAPLMTCSWAGGERRGGRECVEGINGLGVKRVKDGLHGVAAMARSTNRTAEDGDPRITVPTDRGESRDLSEPRELSLEEVLKSYEQPINEEQAWAVCYQCCSGLRAPRPPTAGVSPVKGPASILLHRDGTVSLRTHHSHGR